MCVIFIHVVAYDTSVDIIIIIIIIIMLVFQPICLVDDLVGIMYDDDDDDDVIWVFVTLMIDEDMKNNVWVLNRRALRWNDYILSLMNEINFSLGVDLKSTIA